MTAGPVRFDRFWDRLLYDPQQGFYEAGGGAGRRRGDFLTSPEVGPLFGAVVARALDGWWNALGRPDPYWVVEAGAGRGALALAIRAAAPACAPAMRSVLVERSDALRHAAAAAVGEWAEVRADLPDGPMVGVVLANELLDNLAPRLLQRAEDGWLEVYVGDAGEELRPTAAGIDLGQAVAVGTRLPVLEEAAAWVEAARARLARGRVVVWDYGVRSTVELVGRSWLRTYGGHDRGTDPYADPGRRDVTTDIAVDQLPAPTSVSTQAEFLRRWGIDELVAEGRAAWRERAAVGDLAAVRARSRVTEAEALCEPGGLGDFLALEWEVP